MRIRQCIPNLLSLGRILLAMFLLLRYDVSTAFVWTCILYGAISDFADGYLARRWFVESSTGAILDPLGDKALITGIVIVMLHSHSLPFWWVILTLARDAAIIGGGIVLMCRKRVTYMIPTRLSKVNTTLQLLTLAMYLYETPYTWVMLFLTASTTIASGGQYAIFFVQMDDKRSLL